MTIAISRVDWHDQVHDHLKTQIISPSIRGKWLASLFLVALDFVLNDQLNSEF